MLRLASLSLAFIAVSSGCDSGSNTNPASGTDTSDATGEDAEPRCTDTVTVLDPAMASPLGFSADSLLAPRTGELTTTLTFANEPTNLNPAYKGDSFPLAVSLARDGGEVRFVKSEPNPDYVDLDTDGGFDDECFDRLEVDVVLGFRTEGGEFDEQVETVLVATSEDRAWLASSEIATAGADLYPPPLRGSFDPDTLFTDADQTVEHLVVSGVWTGEAAGGVLEVETRGGGPDGGWVGFGILANWGEPIEVSD